MPLKLKFYLYKNIDKINKYQYFSYRGILHYKTIPTAREPVMWFTPISPQIPLLPSQKSHPTSSSLNQNTLSSASPQSLSIPKNPLNHPPIPTQFYPTFLSPNISSTNPINFPNPYPKFQISLHPSNNPTYLQKPYPISPKNLTPLQTLSQTYPQANKKPYLYPTSTGILRP